ncbi:hypothetical protein A7982_12915 [Minicystis rosea]|nr:hypothetical protein A7982_12915 [Minicystis rosea]
MRGALFDGRFGHNLLATLLPFPVLAGIVVSIYFGLPFPRRARSDADGPRPPKRVSRRPGSGRS